VTITLGGLDLGKFKVEVVAKSKSGKESLPFKLIFWIEDDEFTWDGALIYMVMTDRYRDGDPSNNGAANPEADPRGDFQGGDLEGLRKAIDAGTLDQLGVRAIWLTPFQTNPEGAYLASDGFHEVTGYHGYWPVEARKVEPRIGGDDALRALVKEAHEHGIRILQDFVLNHVHEDHEYVKAHPEWFHTLDNGCVCGTAGCDWTEKALTCLFAPYMPDINHTVPEANAQFTDDAIYWLDEFNLDGLRVDSTRGRNTS
jgi:neopullulanase